MLITLDDLPFITHRYSSSVNATESDQQVINSYRHGKYPEGSVEKYGENTWSPHESHKSLHVRNQHRDASFNENSIEDGVRLGELIHKLLRSVGSEELWYHATTFDSAVIIIHSGPKISRKPSDLAANGAFYLNLNMSDCYEYLFTKKSLSKGNQVILIFRFDPWQLSSRGEKLDEQKWKRVAYNRSPDRECGYHWSYAPQHSDPARIKKKGKQISARRISDGQLAMQLVIRDPKMCQKIHGYLVGCIFFNNATWNAH